MKANPEKCHMLVSQNGSFGVNIGEHKISNKKLKKSRRTPSIIDEFSIIACLTKTVDSKTVSNKINPCARENCTRHG